MSVVALHEHDTERHEEATTAPLGDGYRFIKTTRGDEEAVELLNSTFDLAAEQGYSDVHMETFDGGRMRVRARTNGALFEHGVADKKTAKQIEDKIRMMTKMPLNDRETPQDGRFSLWTGGRYVDVRTSLVPTRDGVSIVCRLLDQRNATRSLADLEMTPPVRAAYDAALARNEGLFLLTGPTGSGKTSTLYTCLNAVNSMEKKLITIEDPVEYRLRYAQQFEVSDKRPFAKLLRASLRQDPEIVLVGEIRDAETAGIAVQASLTGHLVLSTLHTNDAAGAVVRLADLGVDAYTLGTSLLAIVAQRLLNRVCPHCAVRKEFTASDRRWLDQIGYDRALSFAERSEDGCPDCNGKGFKGRVPIMEMIVGSGALRTAIEEGDKRAIEAEARKQPQFRSLVFAALDASAKGRAPYRDAVALATHDTGAANE